MGSTATFLETACCNEACFKDTGKIRRSITILAAERESSANERVAVSFGLAMKPIVVIPKGNLMLRII